MLFQFPLQGLQVLTQPTAVKIETAKLKGEEKSKQSKEDFKLKFGVKLQFYLKLER